MKKGFFLAFFTIFAFSQIQAQVTFRPGLRGGLNFSHFSNGGYNNDYYNNGYNNNEDFTSKTDFYIGFYGALKLAKHYTLQPEINYSSQGSNYDYLDANTNTRVSGQFDISYLSIDIMNKFNFNDKFNFHFGPTIDFVVSKNFRNESDVDLAFVAGLGYSFTKNFGIEARAKKGIIPVFYDNSDPTNVVFQLGATYTFDIK